ncbi:MAG TPA: hypothetical protein VHJ34_15775 [Actinomycetota bacterium]|nr:hypothetical protein [Actinomycetota bacterium]
MRIDCSTCEMYRSAHCDDCLVTVMLRPPSDEVEIDDDLGDGLDALAGAGLVPVLRFRPRRDPDADGAAAAEDRAAEPETARGRRLGA